MSSVAVEQPFTYRDLARMPWDGIRHEIIDGEHVVLPSPALAHQRVLWDLAGEIRDYLRAHPVGEALTSPFDVRFSNTTVFVPDLVFFVAGRVADAVTEKCAVATPDLVVEVLSPNCRRYDKGRKRAVYEREGTPEYWIVDPVAQSVTVLRRTAGSEGYSDVRVLTAASGATVSSPLLPGLEIPVRRLFARVDPQP
jgi:Uma2 family endonuclease